VQRTRRWDFDWQCNRSTGLSSGSLQPAGEGSRQRPHACLSGRAAACSSLRGIVEANAYMAWSLEAFEADWQRQWRVERGSRLFSRRAGAAMSRSCHPWNRTGRPRRASGHCSSRPGAEEDFESCRSRAASSWPMINPGIRVLPGSVFKAGVSFGSYNLTTVPLQSHDAWRDIGKQ
jgi:hypothetical protein